IRMSIRLLTGGQLVRFQPGAPGVCREDVGKRSSRQTFNLEIAGSNPVVLTRVPLVQRIRTRVYGTRNSGSNPERDTKFGRVFQRPGWGTVYALTGVRFPSRHLGSLRK